MNARNLPGGISQPPSSLIIIGACVVIFLLQAQGLVPASLALWPVGTDRFLPWQPVTYGLLHGSFGHLFFNMFAVWMFGLPLEQHWGTNRFLLFFLTCVVGAGIVQLVVQAASGMAYPTIGASGGVFGLLLAYAAVWPNNRIMLIFLPVPIAAKWFVLIYGALELVFGVSGAMPGIAHFAHLGGLFFGAALLWYWGWRPGMTFRR